MKLWFGQFQIHGYDIRVVADTRENAIKALKANYEEWREESYNHAVESRTFEQWCDYSGFILQEIELNKIIPN